MKRRWLIVVALVTGGSLVAGGCGDDGPPTRAVPLVTAEVESTSDGPSDATPGALPGVSPDGSVPPTRVTGNFGTVQDAEIEWALGQFAEAGLVLPAVIEIDFFETRSLCNLRGGRCLADHDPPLILICEPLGDNAYLETRRQIALLHELAHVWHWSLGDGYWVDLSDAVNGEGLSEIDVVERVANTLSWGLLDSPRRPVPRGTTCTELTEWFTNLTGRPPSGSSDIVCVPVGDECATD